MVDDGAAADRQEVRLLRFADHTVFHVAGEAALSGLLEQEVWAGTMSRGELSMEAIIIAAIALLVLVILAILISREPRKFYDSTKFSCQCECAGNASGWSCVCDQNCSSYLCHDAPPAFYTGGVGGGGTRS